MFPEPQISLHQISYCSFYYRKVQVSTKRFNIYCIWFSLIMTYLSAYYVFLIFSYDFSLIDIKTSFRYLEHFMIAIFICDLITMLMILIRIFLFIPKETDQFLLADVKEQFWITVQILFIMSVVVSLEFNLFWTPYNYESKMVCDLTVFLSSMLFFKIFGLKRNMQEQFRPCYEPPLESEHI